MYQHEKDSRKRARALLNRTGHKAGGHITPKSDRMQDEAMIRKAISEHEDHDHKGESKTKIKFSSGGHVDGRAEGGRLDKSKRGGKDKGAHVTVNVIHTGGQQGARPVPVPVPAGGPPMMPPRAPMAGGAPGAMPPGAGGMPPMGPMPGMKAGGKVGPGRVHMTAGAGSGEGRLEKAKALYYGTHDGRGRA